MALIMVITSKEIELVIKNFPIKKNPESKGYIGGLLINIKRRINTDIFKTLLKDKRGNTLRMIVLR